MTINKIRQTTTTLKHHDQRVNVPLDLDDKTPIQHFATLNDKNGHTSTFHVGLKPGCAHGVITHLDRDAMHNQLIELITQQWIPHTNDEFHNNTRHGRPATLDNNGHDRINPPSNHP
jgi:hypothetical protein